MLTYAIYNYKKRTQKTPTVSWWVAVASFPSVPPAYDAPFDSAAPLFIVLF